MKKILLVNLLFCLSINNISAKDLELGSYNVENLFDAEHDIEDGIDKDDWTFLPKDAPGKKEACKNEKSKHHRKDCNATDWNERSVDLKISQIKEILSREHSLPTFLGIQEVENPKVVSRLAKKLGYTEFEMTKSLDARGIDVALLFKKSKDIKKVAKYEHVVQVERATRNILEVEFLIDNHYPLTLFVNHWPSLANPDSWRIKAAEVLLARSQEIMKKNSLMNIVAMGDFNTIDDNNPHPFKTVLYRDHFFSDVEEGYAKLKGKKNHYIGTYYYSPKDLWSSLDHFFINHNLIDQKELELNLESFEIYVPAFATHEIKKTYFEEFQKNFKLVLAPKRFNPKAKAKEDIGYSDHFPIFVKLTYPNKAQRKIRDKN